MMVFTREAESSLIGSIYDCALDPTRWQETLQTMCVPFDGHSAGIVLLDYNGHNDRLVRDWGPTKVWGDRIAEVFASIKRIHRQFLNLSGARLDEPILLPRDLSPQVDVFTTSFYKDWAAPQMIHQVLEAVALSEPTRLGLFCVTRQMHKGPFSSDQIDLLRRLAPHIRRAITISDLLDLKSVERQAFAAVMDTMTAGICVVGSGGRILHTNVAARAMLDKETPIREENGLLRGTVKAVTEELLAAIASAQDGDAILGLSGIGVPLRASAGGHAVAHILPLARGDLRTRLMPDALAAVFINSDGPAVFSDLDAIARSFELTPSETRLLVQLMTGKTLGECAAALSIGETTAKTHLLNMFAKSGVSRQIDLVTLINRLIPAARIPG